MKKTLIFIPFILLFFFIYGCKGKVGNSPQASNYIVFDMVHHNPGEEFTTTSFSNPAKLRDYGYNGQVINEFQSVHCAITYDSFDKRIFPENTEERFWVEALAQRIDKHIEECHEQNLKALFFTDIIVFPKRLKELYKDEICDGSGRIDFSKPKTQEIHRVMIKEIFDRFPRLDGLVIRVGETYLHNIPYHTGNGPIKRDESRWDHNTNLVTDGGEKTHTDLINLLRDEVCVKADKMLIYRTWDFGFFHTQPPYYLTVTDSVEPHENLYFAIKHVQGDYHRTFKFNPTLGIGKHKQIVEAQCQREYEGKGAYPNYVAASIINGFEEYTGYPSPKCLNDLKSNPLFAGVWTWSRGGGWVGPYIKNELWCDLNAYVLAQWAENPQRNEKDIFNDYAKMIGFDDNNASLFREICLLSSKAVVRGRASLLFNIDVWWTRDQFIGGMEELSATFENIDKQNGFTEALIEKAESVAIWRNICENAEKLQGGDDSVVQYIRVSSKYGLYLYSIYEQAWKILINGYIGDKTGYYDNEALIEDIREYDNLWTGFEKLYAENDDCATLYIPYAFENEPPLFHAKKGLNESIDHYRKIVNK